MNNKMGIMMLFILCNVLTLLRADDYAVMERIVDLPKIKANQYTDFIQYAFWPKQEVLSAQKYKGLLIEKDVDDLTNMLSRLICSEYMPSENDLKSVVGIPEYSDGDDYCFMRYTTKSGVHVEVQDGWRMFILISSSAWKKCPLPEISSFVKDIAKSTINYPKEQEVLNNPVVFVSAIDIGLSKRGNLTWNLKGESSPSLVDWYSQIDWWSDGSRILFGISKMTKKDYEIMSTMANRSSMKKPRRFRCRGGIVQSANAVNSIFSNRSVVGDDQEKKETCVRNLRLIDALKEQWKLEKSKKAGDSIVASEIDVYYKKRMPPVCPEGGTYTYNVIGINPECSFLKTNSDGTTIQHGFPK